MAKLTVFDIIALAKAGYKAADIEKLTSVDIPEDEEDNTADNKDPEPEAQPAAENDQKDDPQDKQGASGKEDDVDYKSLYEAKCKELAEAQKTNVHQNQPEKPKTPTIDDIVRSFM